MECYMCVWCLWRLPACGECAAGPWRHHSGAGHPGQAVSVWGLPGSAGTPGPASPSPHRPCHQRHQGQEGAAQAAKCLLGKESNSRCMSAHWILEAYYGNIISNKISNFRVFILIVINSIHMSIWRKKIGAIIKWLIIIETQNLLKAKEMFVLNLCYIPFNKSIPFHHFLYSLALTTTCGTRQATPPWCWHAPWADGRWSSSCWSPLHTPWHPPAALALCKGVYQ